ncbi:MAG: polysaccharide biosynthesis protein, partial [Muribaculaceae bacterium]|nr:polysaccharide biosynthesis protein [Muribaculaceae bacterium]
KDTAIYGVSSIVGRFLNWCLVPLYTAMFVPEEYGVVTNIYAYVALVLVFLTYGMETGFFRFARRGEHSLSSIYTTILTSVGFTSTLFIALIWMFLDPICSIMGYGETPSFVLLMGITVAIDAFTAIPFAYLRFKQRPIKFACLKLVNIALNIGLNLFFILLCPWLWKVAPETISWFYNPTYGVGYIFVANIMSSAIIMLLLLPEICAEHFAFNSKLLKTILTFSLPLLIAGLAGIMNQNIDKIIYPFLFADQSIANYQLGIYGANYKIAMVMIMFIQAFRFAYEPLMFSKKNDNKELRNKEYADAMKYFVIFGLLIFLGVMFYLDIFKYIISAKYYEGLVVVPILLAAELCYGIVFNLSLWYKNIDKTYWAIVFTLIGFVVMISIIITCVPVYGYIACAWAALACNAVMMICSYIIGNKVNPIKYETSRILSYVVVAGVLFVAATFISTPYMWLDLTIRTLLIFIYIAIVIKRENIKLKLRR